MRGLRFKIDRVGLLAGMLAVTALAGCLSVGPVSIGGEPRPAPLAGATVGGVQYRVDAVETGQSSGVAQSPIDLAGVGGGWVVSREDGRPMTATDEPGAYRAFSAHCKGLIGPGSLTQYQGKSVYRFRECSE